MPYGRRPLISREIRRLPKRSFRMSSARARGLRKREQASRLTSALPLLHRYADRLTVVDASKKMLEINERGNRLDARRLPASRLVRLGTHRAIRCRVLQLLAVPCARIEVPIILEYGSQGARLRRPRLLHRLAKGTDVDVPGSARSGGLQRLRGA